MYVCMCVCVCVCVLVTLLVRDRFCLALRALIGFPQSTSLTPCVRELLLSSEDDSSIRERAEGEVDGRLFFLLASTQIWTQMTAQLSLSLSL